MTCRLLIFTRYPVAGKTKTRLIPALGAAGAARLQRRLTEKLLAEARLLEARLGASTVLYHVGGSGQEMRGWLGRVSCVEQAAGDLGRKMRSAFAETFAAGTGRAVLVGTDIPQLDAGILGRAFAALEAEDAVIGPSRDGGYYLIGLTAGAAPHLLGPLFDDMTWSTGEIYAVTMARLAATGRSVFVLPTLADIDRPEDLPLASELGLI
jgi:rSAM/selenodomain-associated transferase 1